MEPLKTRRKQYNQLRQLDAKLRHLSRAFLKCVAQEELIALKVRRSELDLLAQDADDATQFIIPYPRHEIDRAFNKAFEDSVDNFRPEWPSYFDLGFGGHFYNCLPYAQTLLEYFGSRAYDWQLIGNTQWETQVDETDEFQFHEGIYDRHGRERWEIIEIVLHEETDQPHIACVLVDGIAPEEDLRVSELQCVVWLMMRRIWLDKHAKFRLHPVIVYSFADYKARIIQACLKDDILDVRVSSYVDLKDGNDEKIKLILRWMMNTPTGNTRYPSMADSNASSTSSTSSDIVT